ncbi:MAG: hypothetical protein HY830_21340, partial [Actinobacteria bacterium]|nr:hypothetical protein [Actinomycetota bacterium]
VLNGEAGSDRLGGGLGDDTLDGGPAADECAGDTGATVFIECEKTTP